MAEAGRGDAPPPDKPNAGKSKEEKQKEKELRDAARNRVTKRRLHEPSAAPPGVLSRPVYPPESFAQSIAAGLANIRQPAPDDPARYPIVKLVAISITHGSSVGEMNCQALPYATHDFRHVFFFGDEYRDISFTDPRFKELFSSKRTPFKPDKQTMDLLLGMDRPKCRYEEPNVYLPPIVFTLEPSIDQWTFIAHNLKIQRLMGLYLYIIRQNPVDKKLFMQKLKVANYDDLNQEIYLTYSIIFGRFHKFIKANAEYLEFMKLAQNPLTVGFFCCRGPHLRRLYVPSHLTSITNPHTCLPPLPIISYSASTSVVVPPHVYPRLFLLTTYAYTTLESLHQGRQPLLQRGMRNMNWQSCLYNLLFFFHIISRESADALSSVASSQQVRQLSTDVFLVSGESTQEAIRILNGLIRPTVHREYIVQRLPILLGIYKIMLVLKTAAFNNTYIVFVKVYPAEFVPTEPSIPSQIGHWVAIARFKDQQYYYIDVQSSKYIPITDINDIPTLFTLFTGYVVMDLLYILTNTPFFHGPDVLNLQLPLEPPPPPPSETDAGYYVVSSSDSDGGGMRRRVMSKKRKFKSKMKTRTNRRAVK
jgi:hypothetical protein